ncbi:MAG: hypothetical protein JW855_03380, partial [Gammaproteobacteria bacterium]|nr:hypothetical protein [Gammaproteobacteria bacterium]
MSFFERPVGDPEQRAISLIPTSHDALADELWLYIANKLPPSEQRKLGATSHRMEGIVSDTEYSRAKRALENGELD